MQTTKSTIANLQLIWTELMDDYKTLVSAYGLGHNMPEEKSQEATELMNHAEQIRKKISELKKEAGIKEEPIEVESNVSSSPKIELDLSKSFEWAIYMLAKLSKLPKLCISTGINIHMMDFVTKMEVNNHGQAVKMADNKLYQDWFKARCKPALLHTIGLIQQNQLPKGAKVEEWAQDFLDRYMQDNRHVQAYWYFKDKYFGDSQNQAV
jgi:hypothetical protein